MPPRRAARLACLCLGFASAAFGFSAPAWWRRGWAKRPGSAAEAELLAQLAVRLQPKAELKELFRRFPAPEGWGGHYLEPDLALHGVLKDPEAALFVEYDGRLGVLDPRGSERHRTGCGEERSAAVICAAGVICRAGEPRCS
ncbi:unnamed protein product [Effrenium voratum]|uniref:Uncharacterized protein n=1 Tax=Effrenium voratum TaxID=2562239 RepID=A0AA36ITS6_9DINO|nr:unnamed protein product [Effrenium voratum]